MIKKLLLLFFFLVAANYYSQTFTKPVDSLFNESQKMYQEVVYAHLNKSKFINGEMLGFTAYILNRETKALSRRSKNLYCTLEDENNNIVASKLFMIKDGIVNGFFEIDDNIPKQKLTFKAYTNWMQNFPQKNHFSASIQLLDIANFYESKKLVQSFKIDAQFLPESGHLVNNILNTVGVVIKDSLGLGVPNVTGKIIDDLNTEVTSFKTNKLGIGRFSFIPNLERSYTAQIINRNKVEDIPITIPIEDQGLILKISRTPTSVFASVVTRNLYPDDEDFYLTVHNGKSLEYLELSFLDGESSMVKLPLEGLTTGVNVFTVFNSDNEPIAERLFFNHFDLNILKTTKTSVYQKQDSAKVILDYGLINEKTNLSISVLPTKTKSYVKNTNIISKLYIEPYIKGNVENADYYFNDIDNKKLLELDNLLITQGWSSYDWTSIFGTKKEMNYAFEQGLDFKVNIPGKKKKGKYYLHPTSENNPVMITIDENTSSFSGEGYFYFDDEKFYISKVDKRGNLYKTPVYVQFGINSIPTFKTSTSTLNLPLEYYAAEEFVDIEKFYELNKNEVLDEVVITADLEKSRREKIQRKSNGKVYFIEKKDIGILLSLYLDSKPNLRGYEDHKNATLIVYNTLNRRWPAIFLNGMVTSYDQLYLFPLIDVEYVDIDLNSLEGGVRYKGGTIKIKSDPLWNLKNKKTTTEVKVPLTFTKPKKYYNPKFQDYNDSFFKKYGVVSWLPENKLNDKGEVVFTIDTKKQKEVIVFIEGITNSGVFFLEEKRISLK